MKTSFYFIILFSFTMLIACKENIEKKDTPIVKEESETEEIEKIPEQILTVEDYIASAVLAAPKEFREQAKVYGFDENGKMITLREGENEIICIADDPNRNGFEVVAYHKDLEPFMARGRVLKAEGKSAQEKAAIREKEAIDGSLEMPKKSATLHILFGENGYFDIKSKTVKNAHYRYVVYMPFATQASTGLSLKPNSPGHPWLMFPGKAYAHIMISPPIVE